MNPITDEHFSISGQHMKLSQFKYKLPEERIALYPADCRDESRLLVLHKKTGEIEHRIFKEVINYFDEKDVFVMNDSKVRARVEELKQEVIKGIRYEREDCFKEIDEILSFAKQEGNYQLALKAIEDKGKLMQLFVEKIENHNINTTPFEVVVKQ